MKRKVRKARGKTRFLPFAWLMGKKLIKAYEGVGYAISGNSEFSI